jgi:ribose transport system permease protein
MAEQSIHAKRLATTERSWLTRLTQADFVGPLAALLVIGTFIALTTPNFLAIKNFENISLQIAVLSIVAIGSTVVIITGGIDLSPGSTIALLTMCLAVLVKLQGLSLWFAIPLTLLLGALLGAFNGFLVAYLRIPSFIVTLAALSGFKGLALTVGPGSPVFQLSPELRQIFYGSLFGLPLPFIYVVLLYAFFFVLLEHSKLGREIYAIGGNESAAKLSGILVSRVRLLAFVLAGVCSAVGAVLLAARLNSGSPNYGEGTELQAIAAAVVGGASLAGGRGRVVNTLIGALIIIVVQNGLNLNAVSTSMQNLTIGVIILLAVGLDTWGRDIRERIRKLLRRSVAEK